ncbi:MAG: biopolymer transporter ExbD [Acidobacteria bacterium]|nr:biopolymer transporter ExbD [Acidobacteriota bacterium]NIM63158.1 biopolymer transporter ExbD [Acidobacteriota bacterium]NIQ86479.1 biopolymer transporter ExbD [Acidobacteriota bacterium]NIT10824.1 biopolymer transporter ExbD [Acidobacteriota bacterium]
MRRMTRNKRGVTKLNLTPLMDVFTVLVFFLMINSATVETLQQPKQIKLPESVVEAKPRETVVIFVGMEEVLVQGEPVATIADIEATNNVEIEPISARLAELSESVIGLSTQAVAESQEVTVLADKSVPFSVLKKIMASCTGQGYTKVSLAVVQKSAQSNEV